MGYLLMSEGLEVTLKVAGSLLLVAVVLWWMWRRPYEEGRYFAWAPPLALGSAWFGLVANLLTLGLWVLPGRDVLVTGIFLLVDPAAAAMGILTLWIYRGHEGDEETVQMQCMQARVGIGLTMVAVAIGYAFVMTHKTPFTPTGM